MTVQVYINQEPAGELTVTREGLYTVLEAEAPDCGGLVRLWAHGGGESAYLGVMEPGDSGLLLRRRLTRRELAAFPDPIEFVSDGEHDGEDKEDLHNTVDVKEEAAREEAPEAEAANTESLHNTETDYSACPWPAEPPEEGLLWYSRGDGSLTAFDGVSSLLALPAELRTPGPSGAERVIEGKKYLVFRY